MQHLGPYRRFHCTSVSTGVGGGGGGGRPTYVPKATILRDN